MCLWTQPEESKDTYLELLAHPCSVPEVSESVISRNSTAPDAVHVGNHATDFKSVRSLKNGILGDDSMREDVQIILRNYGPNDPDFWNHKKMRGHGRCPIL